MVFALFVREICWPEKGGKTEKQKCSPELYSSIKEDKRREASLLELFLHGVHLAHHILRIIIKRQFYFIQHFEVLDSVRVITHPSVTGGRGRSWDLKEWSNKEAIGMVVVAQWGGCPLGLKFSLLLLLFGAFFDHFPLNLIRYRLFYFKTIGVSWTALGLQATISSFLEAFWLSWEAPVSA